MTFLPSRVPAVFKYKTVPAPTGGLNARDSLANMPETDALVLNNWWPQPYGLQVRPGYEWWTTGLPGAVNTLASWSDVNGTTKLFAWAGTATDGFGVYDVSTRMLTTDPPLVAAIDGLSNSRWYHTQMSNSAGNFLIAVNGADAGIVYESTGAVRILYAAVPPAPPTPLVDNTWYGLDSSEVICITTHQKRLWAVKKDSSLGWFLAPNALWGEWKSFDFGPLFSMGGYIAFITTWTIDDGNGAEDHLVIMSSEGQVAVYGGTDPEDDTKWQLVGLYFAGAPASGRRGYYKVGGDMILLTQRGLVSMAALLVSTKVNEPSTGLKSEKVQLLISTLLSDTANQVDWELYFNASLNMFLINIPSPVLGGNRQLACNLVTSASPWTYFVNVDAVTWATYDNYAYFSDYEGRVCRFWVGNKDAVHLDNTGGLEVKTEVQQAYNYLGVMAVQKQVGMYRPTFITSDDITFGSRIEYDFQVRPVAVPSSPIPNAVDTALWDTALWDQGRWGGGVITDRRWVMAEGIGSAASLRMAMQSQCEVTWVGTDYSFRVGGLL